jgi:hypothetical protein
MNIVIPSEEDANNPLVPSIAVLRPHYANENQLMIDELAAENLGAEGGNLTITSTVDIWEVRRGVELTDRIHELIADTAERISPEINVTAYQLRHRENRDCYTHDLETAERNGAMAANVITVQDANLGKIRYFRNFMRYAICQRLIILFSDRSRMDDYLEDLGLTHESVDSDSKAMTKNCQRKIHLVPELDEDAIERAVKRSLEPLLS